MKLVGKGCGAQREKTREERKKRGGRQRESKGKKERKKKNRRRKKQKQTTKSWLCLFVAGIAVFPPPVSLSLLPQNHLRAGKTGNVAQKPNNDNHNIPRTSVNREKKKDDSVQLNATKTKVAELLRYLFFLLFVLLSNFSPFSFFKTKKKEKRRK